jgi:hypothetical protein
VQWERTGSGKIVSRQGFSPEVYVRLSDKQAKTWHESCHFSCLQLSCMLLLLLHLAFLPVTKFNEKSHALHAAAAAATAAASGLSTLWSPTSA